jgi:hypothetical protein
MLNASMAAKRIKKASPNKTVNKSKFVRSLPRAMPAKEVVAKAKAAGIVITDKYVSTIRYNAKVSARKKAGPKSVASAPVEGAPPVKRGPGRPRKSPPNGATNGRAMTSGGLEAAIEAIVERRVAEILKGKLGSLFG